MRHQRVVGEARVLGGVLHLHEAGLVDGVGAEGDGARGLARGQADVGLEPLARLVHQADQGDGGLGDLGGQQRELVEHVFFRRVQDVQHAQGIEARLLVGGLGGQPAHKLLHQRRDVMAFVEIGIRPGREAGIAVGLLAVVAQHHHARAAPLFADEAVAGQVRVAGQGEFFHDAGAVGAHGLK